MKNNRKRKKRESGSSIVEVALLAPWIFFLFVGVFDFGFYAYAAICTQNAARAVALAAAQTSTAGVTACNAALGEMRMLPNVGSNPVFACGSGTTVTQAAPVAVCVGGTMNLGPGQYVMAGTNSTSGDVFANNGTVDGTSTAAQATGTMFLFTDAAYPGMNLTSSTATDFSSLVSGGSALNQGTITANGSLEMYGLVNSSVGGSSVPAALNTYTGVTWWQDRRNSVVGYNEAAGSPGCNASCTGDDGSVISCAIGCTNGSQATPNIMATANHVTATSPGGVNFTNGNTKWGLHGVYYQPRGAWTDLGNGNTGINCGAASCPLQLITGALFMGNGNTRMVLAGPNNPLISYKAVLIQ
jgi:Flp pilus assembly protein TadG